LPVRDTTVALWDDSHWASLWRSVVKPPTGSRGGAMSRTLTSMSSMVALFYHIALTEGGDFAAWHAPGAFAEESAAVAVVILWGVVGEFAAVVAH